MATPGLASCLVTDRIDYTEQPVPAQLKMIAPAPFDQYSTAHGSATCGDTSPPLLSFRFQVTDLNVEDELTARVLINGQRSSDVETPTIPVTDEPDRGVREFCVPSNVLSSLCNVVEVLVSNDFVGDKYETKDPNDLSRLRWIILGDPTFANDAMDKNCLSWFQPGSKVQW